MSRHRRIVTNWPWCSGHEHQLGTEEYILKPFKVWDGHLFQDGRTRHQRGELYDVVVSSDEEAARRQLEHGDSKVYGRNVIRFVMSRAARRRGYTTQDSLYVSGQQLHAGNC